MLSCAAETLEDDCDMFITESGRAIRRQSDFGMTYSILPTRSGLKLSGHPDSCPDGRFHTLRAPFRSRSLAHRVRPFLSATKSARHQELEQAAV